MSDLTQAEIKHLFGTTLDCELKARKDLTYSKLGRIASIHNGNSTYSFRTQSKIVAIYWNNLSPEKKMQLATYRRWVQS